ncbi:MAG: hypothetical protein ABI667_02585 [Sphingomicrobium sp.]
MAGRLAWILAGGAAIVAGMAFQGDMFSDGSDRRPTVEIRSDQGKALSEEKVDGLVDRIIQEKIAESQVVDDNGDPVDVDSAVMKELASAVTELVKANGALALMTIGKDPAKAQIDEAQQRIDDAQARVDALTDQLDAAKKQSQVQRDDQKNRIREQVRDEVRRAVRSGV